jgi:glycosyltransferase involved in cell wall biosynthesis
VVAGAPDPGNPSSLSPSELEAWGREGLIEWIGHVDGIERWIASSTLVVLPSYREGVPRILLEAAAMGKPIVCTDVPGCREVVEDGRNGLRVRPRDAKALAAAIDALLRNPELRKTMGEAGRSKVLREFSEDQVLGSTLGVYRELRVLP